MSSYSLNLRSDHPALLVEFRLPPGTHAHIGSDPDAEISLPLAGLAAVVCVIGRDRREQVYLAGPNGENPRFVELPALLPLPPYQFVVFHPEEHPTAESPPNSAPKKSVSSRSVIAGAIAFGLLTVGAVLAVNWNRGKAHPPAQEVRTMTGTPTSHATHNGKPMAQDLRKEPPAPAKQDPKDSPGSDRSLAGSDSKSPASPAPVTQTEAVQDPLPPPKFDLEQLAQRLSPAVFMLEVKDARGEVIGTGTAFSISADGLAATNCHVVENGISFVARTNQGAEFAVSGVVAVDQEADLALIALKAKDLPFLELGNTSLPKVGTPVAVFGCPRGLTGTLSEGIVSSIRSEPELQGKTMPNGGKLIQTTAPISPGSSGSPVVDESGKVIGVAVAGFAAWAAQNLNFVIPVEALVKLKNDSKSGLAAEFLRPRPEKSSAIPRDTPDPDAEYEADPDYEEVRKCITAFDWIRCSKLARPMAARHPNSPKAHAFLGMAMNGLGLNDQAETAFRASLALDSENGWTWGYLGVAQHAAKKTKESRESFRRALGILPDSPSLWQHLAASYLLEEDFLGAIGPLENLRKLDRPEFDRLIGILRNHRGHPVERDYLLAHFDAMPDEPGALGSVPATPEKLVGSLISRFLQHGQGGDVQAELADYAPVVDPYFDQGRQTKAEILKDIATYRAQWPVRTLQLVEVESVDQADGSSLEAIFRLRYSASNGTKSRSGLLRQNITFRSISGRWLVTGIETVQRLGQQ